MRRFILSAFCLSLLSANAYALPFKCDKDQSDCEIITKRWTVGDKIGVFTEGKELVAVGEVREIREMKRLVKITKRWAPLMRSHDMEIIDDDQYKNPSSSFRIVKPLPTMVWSAALGILNLGVGDSFIAQELSANVYKLFWRDISWYGRFHFFTGKGTASDNLGNAGKQDVSVTGYGLSGGLSEMLLPFNVVSIRLDADLGFSNGSVSLSGGFDEEKVLNNRFSDGFGLHVRGAVAGIYRRAGFQPEFGIAFLRVHNANSTGIFLGINAPLKPGFRLW